MRQLEADSLRVRTDILAKLGAATKTRSGNVLRVRHRISLSPSGRDDLRRLLVARIPRLAVHAPLKRTNRAKPATPARSTNDSFRRALESLENISLAFSPVRISGVDFHRGG